MLYCDEVYPRVCGGTWSRTAMPSSSVGLSPRVRGNPCKVKAGVVRSGSIPACAGEPPSTGTPTGGAWVYPRVCGGTVTVLGDGTIFAGLSPRVRGNPPGRRTKPTRKRSIPACAGEPLLWLRMVLSLRVYPRVCGGTRAGCCNTIFVQGLSPRVRGNRSRYDVSPWGLWVYPRVCGGTFRSGNTIGAGVGLSPRVRGNPNVCSDLEARRGSIPACAGEPGIGSCGFYDEKGLSPRVRGNPANPYTHGAGLGSIPACAGEPKPCA